MYEALEINNNKLPTKKNFKEKMLLPENWSRVLLKNNTWIAKELESTEQEEWSCNMEEEVWGYLYKYYYDLQYLLYFGQNPEKYMIIRRNNKYIIEANRMVKLSAEEFKQISVYLRFIKIDGEDNLAIRGDEFDVYPFYRKIDKGVELIAMSIIRLINQGQNTIKMLLR